MDFFFHLHGALNLDLGRGSRWPCTLWRRDISSKATLVRPKGEINSDFSFRFFFWLKTMDESNKPELFLRRKVKSSMYLYFLRLTVFFFTRNMQKAIKKQLKVGYISFIPNLVWISQLVLKFFHCTPREGLAATPWSSPKPTLPPVDDGHWQAMDAAEEAQQKEGDDQILEAPEIWEGLVQQGSNWWFHIFFMSTPTWGNDSIWRIFFR